MPFNLAVFNPAAAGKVIAAHPEIKRWAVGGHSLGGAMAANYAYHHSQAVQGLVLWASYPADNNSLAGRSLRAITVYATADGLATVDKIEASLPLLPANTRVTAISGGSHAGFGWYGPQGGDGQATITRSEQQAQVVEATVTLLAELDAR